MDEYYDSQSVPFWEERYLDQAPPEQQTWYDWQAPLDTEGFRYYETTPIQQTTSPTSSLSIPWREQPTARVGTEVIQPYTTKKTWLDRIGDVFAEVGPSLLNIYSSSRYGKTSAPSYTVLQPTKTAGSAEVSRLVAQGGVTGTQAPSLGPFRAGPDGISSTVLLIGGGIVLLLLLKRK